MVLNGDGLLINSEEKNSNFIDKSIGISFNTRQIDIAIDFDFSGFDKPFLENKDDSHEMFEIKEYSDDFLYFIELDTDDLNSEISIYEDNDFDEVADALFESGLSRFVPLFEKNFKNNSIQVARRLDEERLRDIGISNFRDRQEIIAAFKRYNSLFSPADTSQKQASIQLLRKEQNASHISVRKDLFDVLAAGNATKFIPVLQQYGFTEIDKAKSLDERTLLMMGIGDSLDRQNILQALNPTSKLVTQEYRDTQVEDNISEVDVSLSSLSDHEDNRYEEECYSIQDESDNQCVKQAIEKANNTYQEVTSLRTITRFDSSKPHIYDPLSLKNHLQPRFKKAPGATRRQAHEEDGVKYESDAETFSSEFQGYYQLQEIKKCLDEHGLAKYLPTLKECHCTTLRRAKALNPGDLDTNKITYDEKQRLCEALNSISLSEKDIHVIEKRDKHRQIRLGHGQEGLVDNITNKEVYEVVDYVVENLEEQTLEGVLERNNLAKFITYLHEFGIRSLAQAREVLTNELLEKMRIAKQSDRKAILSAIKQPKIKVDWNNLSNDQRIILHLTRFGLEKFSNNLIESGMLFETMKQDLKHEHLSAMNIKQYSERERILASFGLVNLKAPGSDEDSVSEVGSTLLRKKKRKTKKKGRISEKLMDILEAYGIQRIKKDFENLGATDIKSAYKLDSKAYKKMGFNTKEKIKKFKKTLKGEMKHASRSSSCSRSSSGSRTRSRSKSQSRRSRSRSKRAIDNKLMEILEAYGIDRIAKRFAKHGAYDIQSAYGLDSKAYKDMGFNTKEKIKKFKKTLKAEMKSGSSSRHRSKSRSRTRSRHSSRSSKSRTGIDEQLMEILEAYGIEDISRDFEKLGVTDVEGAYELDSKEYKKMGFNTKEKIKKFKKTLKEELKHGSGGSRSRSRSRDRDRDYEDADDFDDDYLYEDTRNRSSRRSRGRSKSRSRSKSRNGEGIDDELMDILEAYGISRIAKYFVKNGATDVQSALELDSKAYKSMGFNKKEKIKKFKKTLKEVMEDGGGRARSRSRSKSRSSSKSKRKSRSKSRSSKSEKSDRRSRSKSRSSKTSRKSRSKSRSEKSERGKSRSKKYSSRGKSRDRKSAKLSGRSNSRSRRSRSKSRKKVDISEELLEILEAYGIERIAGDFDKYGANDIESALELNDKKYKIMGFNTKEKIKKFKKSLKQALKSSRRARSRTSRKKSKSKTSRSRSKRSKSTKKRRNSKKKKEGSSANRKKSKSKSSRGRSKTRSKSNSGKSSSSKTQKRARSRKLKSRGKSKSKGYDLDAELFKVLEHFKIAKVAKYFSKFGATTISKALKLEDKYYERMGFNKFSKIEKFKKKLKTLKKSKSRSRSKSKSKSSKKESTSRSKSKKSKSSKKARSKSRQSRTKI